MSKIKRKHLSADEQEILEHLQVRVLSSPEDLARCDQLIVEHHYLHDATLVGEHLRYVATYKGQWLALATWSAAAFHLKDRDEFIGWNSEQCRRRRALLANNSRLLVLPEAHSPNLVSRFMKLMVGRLAQDWQARWGHPLALVESFVDPQRYQGTAYKVSGWSHLGKTAGWKRDAADFYLKHDAPKQIWVRELVKKACVKLRAPHLPPEWAGVEAQATARCTRPVKEISSLVESLRAEVKDFRRLQALGYPLPGMISLIVMALATGVRQGPEDLAQYAATLSQPQLRALGFRESRHTGRYRCPKKTTFGRVLAGVDAAQLESVLLRWQQRLTGPIADALVIVDGKKLRRGGVEIVNATNGRGQYLGGDLTPHKSNEIPAARQLLGRLDLRDKLVLTDAAHTQVETAQQVLYEQGGDYLMIVKGNQPTLQATLQNLFTQQVFPPSTDPAPAGAPPRTQPGPLRNSFAPVLGGDPQPSRVPGGPLGCPPGNAGQTQGLLEPRSGVSVEQSDGRAVASPGLAPAQT